MDWHNACRSDVGVLVVAAVKGVLEWFLSRVGMNTSQGLDGSQRISNIVFLAVPGQGSEGLLSKKGTYYRGESIPDRRLMAGKYSSTLERRRT